MEYTLMHREQPVAALSINTDSGTLYRVREVFAPEHLPVEVQGVPRDKDYGQLARALNTWFSGRAIPASRSGFRQAIEALAVEQGLQLTANQLLLRCFGLSLSDQYWVNPADAPLSWQKINFYDNPFSDDVGDLLFGQFAARGALDLVSPCNTSDGWLQKKWKIVDEQRVLVKGSSAPAHQEPYNEVVSTAICRRLHLPHVPYSVVREAGKPYSLCPNMTSNRQDLVNAYALYTSAKKPNHLSAYDFFLERCAALGIPNARRAVNRMLILDFLICNQDRHFGNFGALRDAVTLEWQGIAPIYDSGTSLWQGLYVSQIHPRADVEAKPFRKTHLEQLKLAADELSNIDFSALRGLREEVYFIYEQAHFGEPNRAAVLSAAVAERCDYLQELAKELAPPGISLSDLCTEAKTKAAEANKQPPAADSAPEHGIE